MGVLLLLFMSGGACGVLCGGDQWRGEPFIEGKEVLDAVADLVPGKTAQA